MKQPITYQAILQEARDQGVQQGLLTVVLNMVRAEMDVLQIAKLTGLTVEQIQSLTINGETPLPQKDPLVNFIGAVSHGSLTQELDLALYGDMDELGIEQVLTGDAHFIQVGMGFQRVL